MYEMVFEPWIGSKVEYAQNTFLVLGESHYGDVSPEDWKDFTKYIVKKFLAYKNGDERHESWMNTFTRFSNIVTSNMKTKMDTHEFWESVMFYNYIQRPLYNSRVSPTHDEFVNSAKAFKGIIEKYKPKYIVVWGKRLWNHLLSTDLLVFSEEKNEFYIINNDGLTGSNIFHVYHPSSSYFNYAHWQILGKQMII